MQLAGHSSEDDKNQNVFSQSAMVDDTDLIEG